MEALGLPEMVDAPQPMSAAEFVKLDHAGFRTWLKANNLGDFESTLEDAQRGQQIVLDVIPQARLRRDVDIGVRRARAPELLEELDLDARVEFESVADQEEAFEEQLLRDGVQSDHVARVVIPRRPCGAARQRRRDVGLEVAYCIVTSHLRSYRGAPPLETHRGGRGFPAAAGHPSAAALSARTAARATRSTSSGSRPPANRRAGPAAHCCPQDAARCIPTEPP
ncbi:hypothetical protein M885DRAFT_295296 [Pelagophyceae sp. CCMP2097]|nr:hypothetical protein M885DRAFT_295296 [Pelagophyceae sp. CCMP2097]